MQHNTNNSNYTSREFTGFYMLDYFCPFMRVLGVYSLSTRSSLISEAIAWHKLGVSEDTILDMSTRELLIRLTAATISETCELINEEDRTEVEEHFHFWNEGIRLTTTGDLREMYERKYINEEDLAYLGLDLTDLYEC